MRQVGQLQVNKPCLYGTQCCICSVFTISPTCNVISSVKYVLYFYISTSRSLCAVQNMAVVCSFLISCFPGVLVSYCPSDFDIVPVTHNISGITFVLHIPHALNYYYYYYYYYYHHHNHHYPCYHHYARYLQLYA